jgi:hypothetical protein
MSLKTKLYIKPVFAITALVITSFSQAQPIEPTPSKAFDIKVESAAGGTSSVCSSFPMCKTN